MNKNTLTIQVQKNRPVVHARPNNMSFDDAAKAAMVRYSQAFIALSKV